MFEEMEKSGLREPEYRAFDISVLVTLYKLSEQATLFRSDEAVARVISMSKRHGDRRITALINILRVRKIASTHEVATELAVTGLTARGYLKQLEEVALVIRSKAGPNDPTARWIISEADFWTMDLSNLVTS